MLPDLDWHAVPEAYPGVRIYVGELNRPRHIAVYAVRIDLQQSGVAVTTTGRHPQWQLDSKETQRETTTAFIQRKRSMGLPVVVALNANFYYPVANDGGPSVLRGLAVSNGQLVSLSEHNRWALLFDDQGAVSMQATHPETELDGVQHAIGAYVAIVRDGHVFGDAQQDRLGPRSAAGICDAGRYLFLLAIDGRRAGHSLGASIRETAKIMHCLGAHNALNLDGGGSTALAWRDPVLENISLLNQPSGRPRLAGIPMPGSIERWNAHHIGIVVEVPKQEEAVP